MKRAIRASAREVFNAWLDPKLIQRWLAPQPCVVREVTVDARPGGRYTIVVIDPDGNFHTTTGEYREIVPDHRLVKTWEYHGAFGDDAFPSILTIELRELEPGVTELTLTHEQLRDEEASAGTGAGWVMCLDQLASVVEARD